MPSNIIFFSQPLLPEGIKLVVEASYTSNQHYVPMDRCVKYYTNKEDFDFGGLQLQEIEYGEWSPTIPEAAIEINDINEIPGNIGDMIYVCSHGAYNLMQIVSDAEAKVALTTLGISHEGLD